MGRLNQSRYCLLIVRWFLLGDYKAQVSRSITVLGTIRLHGDMRREMGEPTRPCGGDRHYRR